VLSRHAIVMVRVIGALSPYHTRSPPPPTPKPSEIDSTLHSRPGSALKRLTSECRALGHRKVADCPQVAGSVDANHSNVFDIDSLSITPASLFRHMDSLHYLLMTPTTDLGLFRYVPDKKNPEHIHSEPREAESVTQP